MNKKIILIVTCVAVIAIASGLFARQYFAAVGDRQPASQLNFSLPDLADKPQSVTQWQGKILIINFWATWCPPCLREIPEFIKLQEEYKDKGLQFVGIAIDDKQAVEEYLKRIKINYPVLIGGDGATLLAQQLGNVINTLPFTVIVNQQGQIVHHQLGELTREKVLEVIVPLLTAK
ncbi:Cytochrome c-type biogenesis protein ResA [Methylomonas albis]|uniref:TlpA family protein disulfide reductase n=1 Tax=Methylomonas albis TaxID=1854563 RepID=A0ABR9D3B1_9GAMM|nr:TlpA disulfide reductase family protein [Methylomonas albis]MBD9357555.1 TlpA family protein disulfide reductase [Methylomonas albis]CAD6880851.1 Cytochrome c-type biogenesis protein ResA [Methylomonas albis]